MTPPNQRNLERSLYNCSNDDINYNLMQIRVIFTFTRLEPVDQQIVTGSQVIPLNCTIRQQLHDIITNNEQASDVVIPQLLPNLYRIPLNGAITFVFYYFFIFILFIFYFILFYY